MRYVPPHLRHRGENPEGSEELVKLARKLKGLLNRRVPIIYVLVPELMFEASLSEQNISNIVDEIEVIYRHNRRHGRYILQSPAVYH